MFLGQIFDGPIFDSPKWTFFDGHFRQNNRHFFDKANSSAEQRKWVDQILLLSFGIVRIFCDSNP